MKGMRLLSVLFLLFLSFIWCSAVEAKSKPDEDALEEATAVDHLKQKMQMLFGMLDSNVDGSIDTAEVLQKLTGLASMFLQEEQLPLLDAYKGKATQMIDMAIATIDTDTDNRVTLEEVYASYTVLEDTMQKVQDGFLNAFDTKDDL